MFRYDLNHFRLYLLYQYLEDLNTLLGSQKMYIICYYTLFMLYLLDQCFEELHIFLEVEKLYCHGNEQE